MLQLKELRGKRKFLAGPSRNSKLLVDLTIRPDIWGDGDVEYYRRESWTEDGDDEIRGAGYVRCAGLVGGIIWRRIGVYIRLHNDRVFDVEAHEGELDEEGYPRYSLDTASTLGDYLTTNAESKFIDALGRASMSAGTLTKIIALGVVAIAAVVLASVMGVIRYAAQTDQRYSHRRALHGAGRPPPGPEQSYRPGAGDHDSYLPRWPPAR